MSLLKTLIAYAHELLLFVAFVLSIIAAVHALLNKNDPKAAFGWIGFILVMPLLGVLAYLLFGINRVDSRAGRLIRKNSAGVQDCPEVKNHWPGTLPAETIPPAFVNLARCGQELTQSHLLAGNHITPLFNGEEAYPAMLQAIEQAEKHVFLSSYLFDGGSVGEAFTAALAAAVHRQVDVRVLVDGVGALYSLSKPWQKLQAEGALVETFLPPRIIPLKLSLNLRNHRKLLICDSRVAFTGGMNIRDDHLADTHSQHRVHDVHFMCQGPVVLPLQDAFLQDWCFSTGTCLPSPNIIPVASGHSLCRVVMDGPGTAGSTLHDLFCAVLGSAKNTIRIMTPYFLPTREIISALRTAVLRGVMVEVILPAKNNLLMVHWASRALLPTLLDGNIRIFYQPPPFAHTKLLLLDSSYMLMGSANLDPRSFFLNFELVVENFDNTLARKMNHYFEHIRGMSRECFPAELASRSLPTRIRDAGCWLFSPYL